MKKIIFVFLLLSSMICFFTVPITHARVGQCVIATDFEGYKFIVLIGKQVLLREKTLKEMRLNDYKGYKVLDTFEKEVPMNVAMSDNGVIAYVATATYSPDSTEGDEDNVVISSNVYRYENNKRSPSQPIWQVKGKVNGLATDMNGGKLVVITEDKMLAYRGKDGNIRSIRNCAGVPISIAMSSDGNFVFVVTGKNQLNKYTYDPSKDTYQYDNKGLWAQKDAILGVSTNIDASKLWLITCKSHGWGYFLMEGSKDGNFKKLYEFDDTSYPWDITLSGNSKMAYIPLSFSYILRFSYDPEAKCYVVYKLHY